MRNRLAEEVNAAGTASDVEPAAIGSVIIDGAAEHDDAAVVHVQIGMQAQALALGMEVTIEQQVAAEVNAMGPSENLQPAPLCAVVENAAAQHDEFVFAHIHIGGKANTVSFGEDIAIENHVAAVVNAIGTADDV